MTMKRATLFLVTTVCLVPTTCWAQQPSWAPAVDAVHWEQQEWGNGAPVVSEAGYWRQEAHSGWYQPKYQVEAGAWENHPMANDDFIYTAGLLGKRILRVDVSRWEIEYPDIEFDGHAGLVQLSAPAPWTDALFTSVFHDLFFTFGTARGSTSIDVPGTSVTAKPELEMFYGEIGTTMFLATAYGTRPFIQLGYWWGEAEATMISVNRTNGLTQSDLLADDSDGNLIANVGLECDLHEQIGFRGKINIATEGEFSNSEWHAHLFMWPKTCWFLNTGLSAPFEGDLLSIHLGTGLRF